MNRYELTFLVRGVTVDDHAAVALLQQRLDAMLARAGGHDLIMIDVEADSLGTAERDARVDLAECLAAAGHQVTLVLESSQESPGPRLYPAGTPDYAVPPGATLEEWLSEQGKPEGEGRRALAARLGLEVEAVPGLLAGQVPVDEALAARLAEVTGISVRMWLALEADYRAALAAREAAG